MRTILYIKDLILSRIFKNVMVCFGTSLTEGSGWVKLLKKELPKWYIINFAKGGMNSNWGIDNIHKMLRLKPKVVLMEFAINDAYIGDKPYYDTPNFNTSVANMKAMIMMMKRKGIEVYLLGMNPPFDKFCFGRNPFGDRPAYTSFYSEHRHIAQACKAKYIDITSEWEKYRDSSYLDEYIPDMLHPTLKASKHIIVPTILKNLWK